MPEQPIDRGPGDAPARWASIRALAEAALALPPASRADYLDRACGDDAQLRAEVDAQVDACEHAERSPSFLGGSAAAFVAPLLSAPPTAGDAALRNSLADRYEVERELGRGGMATVYLARDLRHGRSVAIKVLDPSFGAAMSAERFLREISLTASLTHPHILPLHDSGEAAGQLYYVMPYAEGETLRARLSREGALSIREAMRLLRELADALAYAHGQGVVHRDLKPENVLLAGGHAIIADFGIARAVRRARATGTPQEAHEPASPMTEAGLSLGTPAYMAPEQAAGGAVDERTDLYALGLIAYEALTGVHPFNARTPQAMIAAHITETPPPVADHRRAVPPALAALVMRLLAKHPAERPANGAAVLVALEAAHLSTPARLPMPLMFGVAAAVLLTMGITAYAMWPRQSAQDDDVARAAPVIRSLAVLPFDNTGGVKSDDYFSDGLTDELAHALAKLPGLELAGRTATYAFKGRNVSAQTIGKELGVDAFVSARVRRSGERLRVNPQLVSAANGKVLWDSVFESHSGDVFAVQDSLTRAVVAAIAPALRTADARADQVAHRAVIDVGRGTNNPDAYELYLLGMYHFHERGRVHVERSIGLFQQAIGRDPTFARAYAALALAYSLLGIYAPDPAGSTTALIKASARRAVTLDSTLADAQLAEAVALLRDSRFAEAEARHRAALRIEPFNQTARHSFGGMLTAIGRTDEAIAELRLATRLDPLAKSAGTMLAEALIDARRFREAEDEARRVLAIDSTFPLALFSLGLAQALGGRPDAAVRTLERAVQLYPTLYALQGRLIFAYAAAGRWPDVERMRKDLQRPGGDVSGGALPAFADFVLGDRAPLLRLVSTPAGLRRWFDMLRMTFTVPGCNPLGDPLWADAGYRAALRELGVAPCPQAQPWALPPRPGARGAQQAATSLR